MTSKWVPPRAERAGMVVRGFDSLSCSKKKKVESLK
jgi:hypothetical protein